MSDVKSCLRAVEKARAQRDDTAAAFAKHCARERAARLADYGTYSSPHDPTFVRLQKAANDARTQLRIAEAELFSHSGEHIAGLAPERLKVARAALKALDDLARAEAEDRKLQAENGWARMPAIVGELPFIFTAMRNRLLQTIGELDPAKTGRAA